MAKHQNKQDLQERLKDQNNTLNTLKMHLQELDQQRQRTVNDILISTGKILGLQDLLKE